MFTTHGRNLDELIFKNDSSKKMVFDSRKMKVFFGLLFFIFPYVSEASVTSYFNQRTTSSYTDPYRLIERRGDNLEEVLVQNILSAKKSIFVAIQELRLPLVAQALVKKKKEGLDVRVVLEHDYNFNILTQRDHSDENEYVASKLEELRAFIDMNRNGRITIKELEQRDAIYILQKGGVRIIDDSSDLSMGSGLMHHKFVIIDGEKVIVSSANFTMSCVHGDVLKPSSLGNPNSMLLVESKSFARIFNEEFLQLWGNGYQGRFGLSKTYRGPQTAIVDGMKITVQFSPTSLRLNYFQSVNGLIRKYLSQSSRSIESALFVFSDQNLSDAMKDRFQKGVRVGLIMEPKFAYRDYSELLDLLGVQMLNTRCEYEEDNNPWETPASDVGISLLPYGDVLHHKFAVIDEKVVVMGSHNWSFSANHTNDESLVVIEGSQIARDYHQEYLRLKQKVKFGIFPWLTKEIREREKFCQIFKNY